MDCLSIVLRAQDESMQACIQVMHHLAVNAIYGEGASWTFAQDTALLYAT